MDDVVDEGVDDDLALGRVAVGHDVVDVGAQPGNVVVGGQRGFRGQRVDELVAACAQVARRWWSARPLLVRWPCSLRCAAMLCVPRLALMHVDCFGAGAPQVDCCSPRPA
jgi:hypothetical protein